MVFWVGSWNGFYNSDGTTLMQSRSFFLKPALAKTTQFNERSKALASTTVVEKVRPVGPVARGKCYGTVEFCTQFGVDIMAKKGALPHFTPVELMNPDWYIPSDFIFTVNVPGGKYLLFKDKSLPGTGFPGGIAKVETIADIPTQVPIRRRVENNSTTSRVSSDGSISTRNYIATEGSLSGSTSIYEYIPIPWAEPAPYSIRNIPFTTVWLKILQPVMPLNLETLVFKINGIDVTDICEITNVPGGVEILYTPTEDFPLASRVYVDVSVSASPSRYWTFSELCLEEAEFIKITGDSSYVQSGGTLILGPNVDSQTETNSIRAVISSNELMIYRTEHQYDIGDTVEYIADDYPICLAYWFDIVNDFKPPVITNMYPSDSTVDVDVNQRISFDIVDVGLGVDINTLVFTINNLIVYPEIWKYSDNYYHVFYDPVIPYYYNAKVDCFVAVRDLSTMENWANAAWSFETADTEQPFLTNPRPSACAYPVHLKSDIYVDIFGRAGGIDKHSVIFTVDQQEKDVLKHPKIYRLS